MARRRRRWYALSLLAGIVALAARSGHAQDHAPVDFDASFLPGGSAMTVDLSRFRRGNAILPGVYEVDLWLNGEWQARRSLRFVEPAPGSDAVPCLARAELEDMGLAPSRVPVDAAPCTALSGRVPGALTRFDVAEQRLDVEIPQALLARRRRGIPPRDQWRDGISAGLLGWRINLQDTSARQRHRRSLFMADDAGFNAGRWRVRHAGAWSGRRYRPTQTFLQHPVDIANASWRAGDFPLSGDVFEPLTMRGFQLSSDGRMSPQGGTDYAPVVRGNASRRARIRISRGGSLLKELSVPAGPFVIDDLPAAAQGGDLVVDIDEEGGRHRQIRVPYMPMPEMLAESEHRFALAAGRSSSTDAAGASVLQALWRQGLAHGVTLYAGHRRWRSDRRWAGGVAIDTRYGGISLDGTRIIGREGARGASRWRSRYAIRPRHSSLLTAMVAQGGVVRGARGRRDVRMRSARHRRERRIDVLYQQSLARGSDAVGMALSYLARSGEASGLDISLTWSHVGSFAALDVSLRQRRHGRETGGGQAGRSEGHVSVSVPLGRAPGAMQARFAASGTGKDLEGQAGVTGAMSVDGGWAYAASMATRRSAGRRLDASASRSLDAGDVGLAFSRSTAGSSSTSLSAAGAAIVHAGGLTLGPRLGEATGLVRARHAAGARVSASAVGRIDRHGYGVLSDLMPYRWNGVDIDPTGLPLGTTFAATHARVVPTAGAVVLLPFETEAHTTVLIAGRMRGGAPLPFGAEVIDSQGRSMGFVGQGGQALVRWDGHALPITVRWSGQGTGQCVLAVTRMRPGGGLDRYEGACL